MSLRKANWVEQNTATTGTGAITLGASTGGSITFVQAGVIDGELVDYDIEDGLNRESGTGIYTSAGTSLARTNITHTLEAGAYNETNPTPITLSGTAVVRITTNANNSATSINYVKSLDLANKILRSSHATTSVGTRPMIVGRAYLNEFIIKGNTDLSGLGVNVDTSPTVGTVLELGLYRWDGLTHTATLVAKTAGIDITLTGDKFGTFTTGSVKLGHGYYVVIGGGDSDVTLRAGGVTDTGFFPTKDGVSARVKTFFKTGGYSGGLANSYTVTAADVDAVFPDIFATTV